MERKAPTYAARTLPCRSPVHRRSRRGFPARRRSDEEPCPWRAGGGSPLFSKFTTRQRAHPPRPPGWSTGPRSFHLVDVPHDAAGDADRQHGQLTDRLVLDAAGHVDHDPLVDLDLLVVEDHRPFAVDDVIELIGPGV